MEYRIIDHQLRFVKPAKTSRNVFEERHIRYILLTKNGITGIGEAAPLKLLSIDDVEDYDTKLESYCQQICDSGSIQDLNLDFDFDLSPYPSIQFGLETALLDLKNGGKRHLFETNFMSGKSIPINGLVWMSDLETMYKEAITKIKSGYTCIKFKIGTHDFDAECRLLEKIRKSYNAFDLEIRLDANGAFQPDDAIQQLHELKRFDIHSIEQPIQPNQWDDMARLCRSSKIDVALDEELIGVDVFKDGQQLLSFIKPTYIILKPNLIGGFTKADAWIKLCRQANVGWWATSALESNIGLNAIAQWVSQYDTDMPQGLGTGSLYSNNIPSPLEIVNQSLVYGKSKWKLKSKFDV
ncbi:MAG: O-succinylbenzoate synthase [Bacteroidia bacterium]|jgi:O-succinylbenzoate synthase